MRPKSEETFIIAPDENDEISTIEKTLTIPYNVNAHTAQKYFDTREDAAAFQIDLDNAAAPVENPYITVDNY